MWKQTCGRKVVRDVRSKPSDQAKCESSLKLRKHFRSAVLISWGISFRSLHLNDWDAAEWRTQLVCVSSVTSLLGKGYEGSDAHSGQPAARTEALLCVSSIYPSINQSLAAWGHRSPDHGGPVSFITLTCVLPWNTENCLYGITLPLPACADITSRTPEGAV